MSFHEYIISKEVEYKNYPFYSLIMAAMRQADTENTNKLIRAFPLVYDELSKRYHAPGGIIKEN